MAEELVLATPIIESKTTTKYKIISFTMNLEQAAGPDGEPGLVAISLRSDLGVTLNHAYRGPIAITMIKQLNVANLTTKSLIRRVMERLIADGILSGIVQGTPE